MLSHNDRDDLQNLCDTLCMDMLENNPLELHFSIAYPEKMGLENIPNDLIPYRTMNTESEPGPWKTYHQALTALKSSDNTQTPNEAYLYHLLERYIHIQLTNENFPYYSNPLSGSGGVHSQLPILLSEYALRNETDLNNYFKLLAQIPAYLEGLSLYALDQEKNGNPLYEGTIKKIQKQCLELFPEESLRKGTHFLQESFRKRLEQMIAKSPKPDSNDILETHEKIHNRLLLELIAPAYEKLAVSLNALKGKSSLEGLSALPEGKAYYEILLASCTGSDRSVEEIKKMLYERYDLLFEEYRQLLSKRTELEASDTAAFDFPYTTHREMLSHLYENTQKYFPALSTLEPDNKQQVYLKKVDRLLAETSAPAFYLTTPIDANDEHTIYINPEAEMEALDLYTTLAHEGFPGHLYQTAYSQTYLEQQKEPLLRQLLYYGGFTEGWAVYAELFSYDFLMEEGDTAFQNMLNLERCNREIQLCLCSILDIYIHYEGAGLSEVKTLLQTLGLNVAIAPAIYESICDAPGNYPKYYVGYLEILELKEAAKLLWGEDYSDYQFHTWLLQTGGGDFGSMRTLLEGCE